ncbi:MAG: hypothetical protein JRF71_13080 [Deltaproteobacteria bacterium]|nr:hypothetical protein [Deltaproteobacteria bacterium]
MRYYIIRIQVDFETPREMPPLPSSGKQWRSIGYFQTFYCTEKSTEKAKQLVRDFYRKNEINPDACKFRFEHSVWMRGITRIEQLSMVSHELTEEIFGKRDQIGIWFIGEMEHYVSEADYAASMDEEMIDKDLDL